jgi:hypothetical protein
MDLMEENSSPEYMEVWRLDELKMVENIHEGGVCVEYYAWVRLCLDSDL